MPLQFEQNTLFSRWMASQLSRPCSNAKYTISCVGTQITLLNTKVERKSRQYIIINDSVSEKRRRRRKTCRQRQQTSPLVILLRTITSFNLAFPSFPSDRLTACCCCYCIRVVCLGWVGGMKGTFRFDVITAVYGRRVWACWIWHTHTRAERTRNFYQVNVLMFTGKEILCLSVKNQSIAVIDQAYFKQYLNRQTKTLT